MVSHTLSANTFKADVMDKSQNKSEGVRQHRLLHTSERQLFILKVPPTSQPDVFV